MAVVINTEGWTTLHYAVAYRFTSLIHSLLELQDGSINKQDEQGRTPLHLICSGVRLPKDVSATTLTEIQQISTSLHLICSGVKEPEDVSATTLSETQQIIELFLINNADLKIFDNSGKPPLHCLVDHWLSKDFPLEGIRNKIITQFLQCGANINDIDKNGRTLLHYVAGTPEMKVLVVHKRNSAPERLNYFVPGRRYLRIVLDCCNNNRVNKNEHVHIHLEDPKYTKEYLLKLLRCEADINATDNEGNVPLHLAICAEKFYIAEELLKLNINVNVKNSVGQTPLHYAVSDTNKFNHVSMLLLYKGALASIVDVQGNTPVDIARLEMYFPCFVTHLILLMSLKLHPKMHIETEGIIEYDELVKSCERECELLSTYFELNGKSQLPLLFRPHSFPTYIEDEFFKTLLNRDEFIERFPNYSLILKKKFSEHEIRRTMIVNCTPVFSYFGGNFYYTEANRLAYTRNSYWETLPKELKLQILSYLSNEELEYLHDYIKL